MTDLKHTYIFLKEIAASELMIFFDDSPDGRRKLENNLTEINFRRSCNVSIHVDLFRAKSDGKLEG
jgi:hypothetical protein